MTVIRFPMWLFILLDESYWFLDENLFKDAYWYWANKTINIQLSMDRVFYWPKKKYSPMCSIIHQGSTWSVCLLLLWINKQKIINFSNFTIEIWNYKIIINFTASAANRLDFLCNFSLGIWLLTKIPEIQPCQFSSQ